MKTDQKIRVRIAPSPTGRLHLGTARTALFNWLVARQSRGGVFVLRIEDTDKERSQKKYEKDIKEGFKWLSLDWDEEYKQSERTDIYKKYLEQLIEEGSAYEKNGVIFFKIKNQKSKTEDARLKFNDIIRGEISFDLTLIDDFIIAKSLDEPLYNFACAVDDCEMNISQVIRGEDHISNTPKQIMIQKALGWESPQFAHLPLILGPDKSKLSKRHGATSLIEYKKDYLPEAMVNFLALLGWHPKKEREIFSRQELLQEFNLQRVQRGGAVFDQEKLDWLNGQYIQKTSIRQLTKLTDLSGKLIDLEKERAKKLTDFKKFTQFIRELPDYQPELLIWKDTPVSQIRKNLEEVGGLIKNKNREEVKKILLSKENRGEYLWPLRVALSGQKASPGPFEIMDVLGSKKNLTRIKKARKKLD